MILWASAGIVLIGLVNFLVSFTLSMSLAFRSRNIPLTEFWAVDAPYAGIFGESRYHSFPSGEKDSIRQNTLILFYCNFIYKNIGLSSGALVPLR
jgi:hypothetical protein